MKNWDWGRALWAAKILLKVLVTIRFGFDTIPVALSYYTPLDQYDTFMLAVIITEAVLDYLVIDLAFLVFALIASETKNTPLDYLRLPASIVAWVLYLAIFSIAFNVGSLPSFLARATGFVLLAFDTWDILLTSYRNWKAKRDAIPIEEWQENLRRAKGKRAYKRELRRARKHISEVAKNRVRADLQEDNLVIQKRAANLAAQREREATIDGLETITESGVTVYQNENGQWFFLDEHSKPSRLYSSSGHALRYAREHYDGLEQSLDEDTN